MSRLNEMEVFVAVAEAGSFTAAAESLHLTPSGVSKLIGRLEDRLGTRLLHRTTRRVSLTAEGRAYLEQVRAILTEIDAVESSIGGAEAEPRGLLRINVAHGFGMTQVVPVIPDFIARYPQVKVHITFADHMVDLVAEGDDIGIRLGAAGDESLIARKLGSFSRMICAAPAYLERHGVPQAPADLLNHNCLLFEGPEALNHWPFRKPDGSIERISVRGNFRCNSGDALFRMLLDGVGLCYAADFGLSHALRGGLVVPVLQDVMLPIEWPIYAAYPARKHLAAKVRVFVDFLVERLTPAPWLL